MTYQPEVVSEIIQTALSKPRDLGEDYATWTLDRLVDYLHRVKGIRMKRSRISELFIAEGLSWRHEESWFGERVDPDFARKRGAITGLYTAPPQGSVTVCLDEMGPQAASHRLWQARQSGLRLWCDDANGWGGVHRDLHASEARQLD